MNVALDDRKSRLRAEDYPSSDGVPMDNEQHAVNIRAWLLDPFAVWCERTHFTAFAGGNSFVYYGPDRVRDVVGPDLYIVNDGVSRGQEKWIVALENDLKPTLVMEFVSDSTRTHDQTSKLGLYRDKIGVLDYILVDKGPVVRAYHLRGGTYVPVLPDAEGRLACASLPLKVGVSDGWVRWFDLEGKVLPTRAEAEHERAEAERERAAVERERAESERERADALERQVKALQDELKRAKGE